MGEVEVDSRLRFPNEKTQGKQCYRLAVCLSASSPVWHSDLSSRRLFTCENEQHCAETCDQEMCAKRQEMRAKRQEMRAKTQDKVSSKRARNVMQVSLDLFVRSAGPRQYPPLSPSKPHRRARCLCRPQGAAVQSCPSWLLAPDIWVMKS